MHQQAFSHQQVLGVGGIMLLSFEFVAFHVPSLGKVVVVS